MKRRRFLVSGAWLAAGGWYAPWALAGCRRDAGREAADPEAQDHDATPPAQTAIPATQATVIVIGAGMSGIATAAHLRTRGISAIVLEARPRIGGRIRTDHSLGVAVDLGAAWIHGPDGGNPLTAIATAASARTVATDSASLAVFDAQGRRVADAAVKAGHERLRRALRDAAATSGDDQSLAQALAQVDPTLLADPLAAFDAAADIEFDIGGSLEECSAELWDADGLFPGQDVLLPDGYDALAAQVAKGLDIRLGERVIGVDHGGALVTVTTERGSYQAERVVVTLPLGVLQRNGVAFAPELPAVRQAALARLRMGHVNKVALLFDRVFWPDVQYLGHLAPERGRYCYFLNAARCGAGNLLVAICTGAAALAMEQRSDADIRSEVMAVLRAIHGPATPEPIGMLVTRWSSDPFAYGTYSFAALGCHDDDFDLLAAPVGERLFFAGEHTIGRYRGTVHGAYLSGLREAERIIALTRRG